MKSFCSFGLRVLLPFAAFGGMFWGMCWAEGHKVTKTVVTVRPCDSVHCPGKYNDHAVYVVPMYPTALQGEVLDGTFLDGVQVQCTIEDRVTGDRATIPVRGDNGELTKGSAEVHVTVLVCKGTGPEGKDRGEIRLVKMMFPEIN